MTYYIGNENTSDNVLGSQNPRYFYGLRMDSSGYLYFARIDQLTDAGSSLTVNNPGTGTGNFENFEYGVDFLEGIAADHSQPYTNLKYQQYRWDGKNCYYYIDNTGELVVRINQTYASYPA